MIEREDQKRAADQPATSSHQSS